MARIAFIGLTDIGQILARKLKSSGHKVQVCPFDSQELDQPSIAAIAISEVIVSLLPDEDQVRRLYLSEHGLIARMSNQAMMIDCSLIAPKTAELIADSAAERNLNWLDAPYMGSIEEAQAGRLSFIVGASGASFALANPLLLCMGRQTFHAGRSGSGQAARICSNVRQAIIMAATAESLALGVKSGLDPLVLASIMQHSAADRLSLCAFKAKCEEPEKTAPNGLQVGPLLDDLTIAMDCSHETQAFTPLGAMTRNLYSRHAENQPDIKGVSYSSIHQLFHEI
jgi:3-hydroxyisobutyrate dehydrogenase